MRKTIGKCGVFVMLIAALFSCSAYAGNIEMGKNEVTSAEVWSNSFFSRVDLTLMSRNSSVILDCNLEARINVGQVGVKQIQLYDISTGRSSLWAGKSVSGRVFSDWITMSATKGHRYYAIVTIFAGNNTQRIRTNTVKV